MSTNRFRHTLLLLALSGAIFAIGNDRRPMGLDRETLAMIEKGDQFTDAERLLARQILEQSGDDESVLDAIVSSPLVTERDKELARMIMERSGRVPAKVVYTPRPDELPFELVSKPLRFHGDLSYKARDVRTRNDVANFFATNNSKVNHGFANLLEGRISYAPEEGKRDVYGFLDIDLQTRDPETEVLNAYMYNRNNWVAVGTWLEPDFTEFGLRNTEISGTMGHFENGKWMVDVALGETVEDFVPGLDGLTTTGLYLRRNIGHGGMDQSGLSYYYANEVNYLGFTQRLQLHRDFVLRGEFMRRESTVSSQNQGNAWELEMDYENKKVLFQNELQFIGSRFSSTLNPQYTYFTGQASNKQNIENAFTYRFDPYVASSVTLRRNTVEPLVNRPDQKYTDVTWTLSTQKPDRPKYMFVIKGSEKDDSGFSVNEDVFLAMARTTFKARDILTNVEVMRTQHDDGIQPRFSYRQNSLGFSVARPFQQKLRLVHRLNLIDQEFTDPVLSNEAMSNVLEGRYRLDSRTSIMAAHRYRRVANKGFANKYKTQYQFEARRRIDQNASYNLRLESFNYNEFAKGYDARLVQAGVDFSF